MTFHQITIRNMLSMLVSGLSLAGLFWTNLIAGGSSPVGQIARTTGAAQRDPSANTLVFLPIVTRNYPLPSPPGYWSESEYVGDPNTLKTIAKNLAIADKQMPGRQDHLLILDFGSQSKNVAGEWGTRRIFSGDFITATKIVSIAFEFARYYWAFTGLDTESHLTIGIGTNNYMLPEGQFSSDSGAEWGRMLNDIKQKLDPTPYKSQVTILGANDIEDWATYTSTST